MLQPRSSLNVRAAFSHLSETVHLVQKAQNNPNALAIDAKITLEVEDQLRACQISLCEQFIVNNPLGQ